MSEHLKETLHAVSQTIRGNQKVAQDHPLTIYHDLVHNNLSSVVSPCFPVLRSILSLEQWHHLIDEFLQHYQASYTAYHRVSEHFVEFLSELDKPPYPFIDELAHYEWLEIAVENAELPSKPIALDKPIAEIQFIMPPSARFQLYDYPVHLIGRNNMPEKTKQTALVVYRPYNQQKIDFIKINTLSFHCLHFLVNEGYTLKEYLQAVAEQQQESLNEMIMEQFYQFLENLHQQSIIQPKSLQK